MCPGVIWLQIVVVRRAGGNNGLRLVIELLIELHIVPIVLCCGCGLVVVHHQLFDKPLTFRCKHISAFI